MSNKVKFELMPMARPSQIRLAGRMQDLRISLLDRCNFRCPYCMPEAEYNEDYQFLAKSARLSHDEIFRIASIAVGLGVTKLRVTGGEPLLDRNVASLVGRLATLPGVDDLALTTNGMLLSCSRRDWLTPACIV